MRDARLNEQPMCTAAETQHSCDNFSCLLQYIGHAILPCQVHSRRCLQACLFLSYTLAVSDCWQLLKLLSKLDMAASAATAAHKNNNHTRLYKRDDQQGTPTVSGATGTLYDTAQLSPLCAHAIRLQSSATQTAGQPLSPCRPRVQVQQC
jgi:hypothetical protein